MIESDSCFICLDVCDKRICKVCKCFAHDKCFVNYINKNLSLEAFVKQTNELFELKIFSFVSCPICKKELIINKRTTRSVTYNIRFEYALYMLHYYLTRIDSDVATDIKIRHGLMDKLFKTVVKYKSTLLANDRLNKVIKNKLKTMSEDWPKANLYYYDLYETQIKN